MAQVVNDTNRAQYAALSSGKQLIHTVSFSVGNEDNTKHGSQTR